MTQHSGHVEVICGSMFSGKTEELIRRIRAFADNQPGSGFPELDDLLAVRDGLDMTFPSYKRIAFANVST